MLGRAIRQEVQGNTIKQKTEASGVVQREDGDADTSVSLEADPVDTQTTP